MRLLATLLLLAGAPIAPATAQTLYQRLGGEHGVARIVADAVDLYVADPRLAAYFDNVNPAWLKPHFATFLCMVADGPCAYHGRAMGPAHRGLHITQAAFNRVVEDLQQAMRHNAVPFHLQNRLLARLAPMERQIVTR